MWTERYCVLQEITGSDGDTVALVLRVGLTLQEAGDLVQQLSDDETDSRISYSLKQMKDTELEKHISWN